MQAPKRRASVSLVHWWYPLGNVLSHFWLLSFPVLIGAQCDQPNDLPIFSPLTQCHQASASFLCRL